MAHIVWGPQGRYVTPIRPIILAGIVTALLVFGLLVWPTRWVIVATEQQVYRIDRFSGCYQVATPEAWQRPWSC